MKLQFIHQTKKALIALGITLSVGFIGLGAGSALASDATGNTDPDSTGHHHPTHAVGVFLGGTDTIESTEFTFGLEYEYRINQYLGVGLIGEHTPDAALFTQGATVALAAIHVHPIGGLRLTGAVGAEVGHGSEIEEETEIEHGHVVHHTEHVDPKPEVVYRLGAAYDIPIGESFAFAPTVNVDFVNGEENVVFGGVFMVHFD